MTAEPDRARSLLSDVEGDLKRLTTEASLSVWEATTTGTQEALDRSVRAESELRKYLSSTSRLAEIEKFLDSADLDPITRRQLELLAIEHRPNQLPEEVIDDLVRRSKSIESEFHTFRAELDGERVTDNQIIETLRTEADPRRRRAAWEASKQIAPRVAEDLIELVKRRNEAARSLGYRDYYAMQLDLQEIDENQLLSVFGELKERTDAPFARAKAEVDGVLAARFGVATTELRPWHYADPFFQEPPLSADLGLATYFEGRDLPTIARDFYAGVGLPIDDVLARSDLHERRGKDQHAYCIDIDREGDVRILCNVKDDDRWMGILLHELGHAAYNKYTPRTLPWLLRQPAHIAVTEAIALFMDRLLYDPDWLQGAADIRLNAPQEFGRRAFEINRFEMLLMARWVLVMTYFERQLYADPEDPRLDDRWWELVQDLQSLRRPEGRAAPDWAAKIHLTVAPVYYHNYQIGELIASQLGATLREEALGGRPALGYVRRGELGEFMRGRVFSHGASLHWGALLDRATGSELSVEPFLDEFVRPD